MNDNWISLENFQNLSGGSAKSAGFVKKLEAINIKEKKNKSKLSLEKMKNPSQYMRKKYGHNPLLEYKNSNKIKKPKKTGKNKIIIESDTEPDYEYVEPGFEYEPTSNNDSNVPFKVLSVSGDPVAVPIMKNVANAVHKMFSENEKLNFNVGKPKKKKVTKHKQPTEAQEERAEAERLKELERRSQLRSELNLVKTQVVELKKQLGKEDTKYYKARDELKSKKWRKAEKEKIQETLGNNWRKNREKIKSAFKDVFQYIKTHKLNINDLNDVYKHINTQIKKL